MSIHCQKLCNWFRLHHGGGSTTTRVATQASTKVSAARPLQDLLGVAARRPAAKSPFALYQKEYWILRVKPTYDRLWAEERKLYADCTPQERIEKGLLKPVSVRTMTKTTSNCWAAETTQFKAEVALATAAWNEKLQAAYERGLTTPITPLDYHK